MATKTPVRAPGSRIRHRLRDTAPYRHLLLPRVVAGVPLLVLIAPGEVEIHGRQAYTTSVRGWLAAFPDLRWAIMHRHVAGDTVVIESTASGAHMGTLHTPDGRAVPATGRTFANRLCEVDVVRDGRVAITRLYWDNAAIMQQLGLLPDTEGAHR